MKADAWMPFYVGDYLRDTMHLSYAQHGIYLLLLLHYWSKGEALPDDDAYLAGVSKCMANEWQSHRQTISKFFQLGDGKWRHKRVEAELERARKLREARSNAGKSGANSKWRGKTMAEPMASPQQSHTQSQSHIELYKEAKPDSPVEPPVGFPKTLSEAKAHASFVGCTEDFAEVTWHKSMGRGGRDAKDIPVRNWRSFLATEWAFHRAQQEKEKRFQNQHGARQQSHRPGIDRSTGTANEGKAGDYSGLG